MLNIDNQSYFCADNCILFFGFQIGANSGNPNFEIKSVGKFFEIREALDLCNIRRIRNRDNKRFTFCQIHFSSLIQRRLDYVFIPNILLKSVVRTEILGSFLSNHSPVSIKKVNLQRTTTRFGVAQI